MKKDPFCRGQFEESLYLLIQLNCRPNNFLNSTEAGAVEADNTRVMRRTRRLSAPFDDGIALERPSTIDLYKCGRPLELFLARFLKLISMHI